MCNSLKCQSALNVDIDEFDGSPTNYHYLMAIFKEVVESETDYLQECPARLIKYNKGEAKDLTKHCVQ